MNLKVFTGNSNRPLAQGICEVLGIEPGAMEFVQFSNENIKVKIEENVRGCDVFYIQTSCPPVNDHLMELLKLKFCDTKLVANFRINSFYEQ